jgi:hypothetical protein
MNRPYREPKTQRGLGGIYTKEFTSFGVTVQRIKSSLTSTIDKPLCLRVFVVKSFLDFLCVLGAM